MKMTCSEHDCTAVCKVQYHKSMQDDVLLQGVNYNVIGSNRILAEAQLQVTLCSQDPTYSLGSGLRD